MGKAKKQGRRAPVQRTQAPRQSAIVPLQRAAMPHNHALSLAAFAYIGRAGIAHNRPMQKAAGRRRSTMLTVLLTALATGALVLLALNFTAGEKKVQQQLPRLYSTASPDFERALGSLLGPGIVGGNAVTELLNGNQIFPPMLAAIQGATKKHHL
jgi:hypothetical protein